MFTIDHLIWVGICIVFIGALLFVSLKFKFDFKKSVYVVSAISFLSELSKIFTHIDESEDGGVLGAEFLPLHLCSILIFAFFYLNFAKNEKIIEPLKSLICPIAILGGICAIAIPTSGVDFLKPYAYQCFLYHSGIIWFALYLIITKQVSLGFKEYKRTLGIIGVLVIVMLWINSALQVYNTNFFYLVRPPMKNLPVLNLNNGWLSYFLTLVVIGVVAITLFFLPFIVIEQRKKKTK